MPEVMELYKCDKCRTVVMVTHSGEGDLRCGQYPLRLLEEKTEEEGLTEKHVPVIEKTANGIRVKIGSIPHPMVKEHYIQWVSIRNGQDVYYHIFRPGDVPEAEFPVNNTDVKAQVYCNVHDLWTNRK